MHRLILAVLLLAVLIGCQQVTAKSATVYVHGRAPVDMVVNIYYPTGSMTTATTRSSGYWGQTVTRQSGTFTLMAPGGCIARGPAGATVSDCQATFKLPAADTFGDFDIEVATVPMQTLTPTPTATPYPTPETGELYICNRVQHLEAITVNGRLAVVVVCAEKTR